MNKGIPISIVEKSREFKEIIEELIDSQDQDSAIYIADFAAGENDEVPIFIHQNLSNALSKMLRRNPLFVYCIDAHTLRIESLFDKLRTLKLDDITRVVFSKFETMGEMAKFPEVQLEYFSNNQTRTYIDESIISDEKIPRNCFHIGILNNDVVGYIHEYYKEYTDPFSSLEGIRNSLVDSGILIVTQPCMLYHVDNIEVLQSFGFKLLTGLDFDVRNDIVTKVDAQTPLDSLSKLGHYSVLIFKCDATS